MGWASIIKLGREPVATFNHSVKIMAEKENNQKRKSTVDKYFSRTADAYKAWAEEDEEERNYLQIAAETTGDTDEAGNQGFDFHIPVQSISSQAELHKQWKRMDSFASLFLKQQASTFTQTIKIKNNETGN